MRTAVCLLLCAAPALGPARASSSEADDASWRPRANKQCGLVLARYAEPVEWALPLLREGVDVTVLNRGSWGALRALVSAEELVRSEHEWEGVSPGPGRLRVRNRLANVGREGFAFLEYMVEHARAWKHEVTAFCQADPKARLRFYTAADLVDDVSRLCGQRARTAPPLNPRHELLSSALRAEGFAFLSRCPLYPPDQWNDKTRKRVFPEAFARAFNATAAEYQALRWCPTSCFAVTRASFLDAYARKRGTFEELVRMLGRSNRPMEAEMLERAWGGLFARNMSGLAGDAQTELVEASTVAIDWRR